MTTADDAAAIFEAAAHDLTAAAATFGERRDPEAIIGARCFAIAGQCFEPAATAGLGEQAHHEVLSALRVLQVAEGICNGLLYEGWFATSPELVHIIDYVIDKIMLPG